MHVTMISVGEWQGDRPEEGGQLPVIVATNVAPVSTSVTNPAFAADSMAAADFSACPFTVLAKGKVGVAVSQLPLVMPASLQKTKKPRSFVEFVSVTVWSCWKGNAPWGVAVCGAVT